MTAQETNPSHLDSITHLEKLSILSRDTSKVAFRVCTEDTPNGVGNATLRYIDNEKGIAKAGVMIEPRYQRNGHGRDAMQALLAYAFQELHLKYVYVNLLPSNVAGIGYAESCGYRKKKHLPRGEAQEKRLKRTITMGIFQHEWISSRVT